MSQCNFPSSKIISRKSGLHLARRAERPLIGVASGVEQIIRCSLHDSMSRMMSHPTIAEEPCVARRLSFSHELDHLICAARIVFMVDY